MGPTFAVPTSLLNLSAMDFDKWTASLGGAIYIGKRWRFDGVWAHTFVGSVWVDPSVATRYGTMVFVRCKA